MMELLRRLRRDRLGATAIEYGLILALICVAMLLSLYNLAGVTVSMWNNVAQAVANSSAS
jgi:pilus assembly protein Flp/PilA